MDGPSERLGWGTRVVCVTIFNGFRSMRPDVSINYAYAPTNAEAAVKVNDGFASFPFVIRSPRTAQRYIGGAELALADAGLIDTSNVVEPGGGRYFFTGHRSGIINIEGLKVHPEEIEAVINWRSQARMSVTRARRSPVTGSIVVADVVLTAKRRSANDAIAIKNDILKLCGESLPRHKVPASINFGPVLDAAATGKLARRYG